MRQTEPFPAPSPPLVPGEVERLDGDPACGLLLLCDHASNAMPPELDSLGLPPSELERHIAYDIGAAAITRMMAAMLGAPALLTSFSRLLIDPNRGRDDPTLVMRVSDGAIIPGNRRIDDAGIAARVSRYYVPYDAAIDVTVEQAFAAGAPPAIVAIHSFTPFWKGAARPWHVGVLWDRPGLSQTLMAALRAQGDVVVGDNEPYHGGLPGDTLDRHAARRGLPDTLIEVRQDLITREEDALAWGARLATLLPGALAEAGIATRLRC